VERVNLKIGPIVFDHANYDDEGDVLYLHVGEPQKAEGEQTPEGHVLRFVPGTQEIIGLTILGARRCLELDGKFIVTIPQEVEASAEDLAPALAAV
jgi:uncharacterized protein YuzE